MAFIAYASDAGIDVTRAEMQYEVWQASGWRDGNDKPIKNWKGKLFTFHKFGYGAFGQHRRMAGPAKDRIEAARQSAQERERKADEYERRNRNDAVQ